MIIFVKNLHIAMAVLTLASFFLRGLWMLLQSPIRQSRWVKIAPHLIDTLLLGSALVLAGMLSYSPGAHPWLMAKIVALVIYIGLGFMAFKHSHSSVRLSSWLAALVVIGYIFSVALSKNPWGFLLPLNQLLGF